ncbi:spore germination protein [Paenibacillus agricola]|uniref:Spore germination protein n=1 Tax=Paenibacillus agricola TaxID=2716264 RepID=A0ABX0J5V0_9BACL|nr:spore germination protein [Paenibacillus agricola]NHN31502.1 spore germination protein [Paenibacillus agricola]
MNVAELEPVEGWNKQKIKALFPHSADVQIQSFRFEEGSSTEVTLIYSGGLCDSSQIGKVILPELESLYQQDKFCDLQLDSIYVPLPLIPVEANASSEQISEWIFQGDLLLLFSQTNVIFKMDIARRPDRTPEESSTEISIHGPKDGFVENIAINVALIRKRIRSHSLCYETSTLGRRTRTKVGLLYIQDIISPELLNEVKKRLSKIDVDGLQSINQIEEKITDYKYSLLPLFDYTGRPDKAVSSLLAGRFVIIVDGNPMVLMGPGTLLLLLKSPEDLYFSFGYISFARLIRGLSFFLSIIMPGAWVALTSFHPDQIPFRLMATVASARIGLPFSGQVELFILLVLLEIFREAGLRLPSSIGQTLTVVGGLVIGDAAIRAGLSSPSVVVVGAIVAVTGSTLVSQSLSGAVSVLRFALFFISAVFGMYGLIIGLVLLIGYMSSLRSFGVPYMSPLSPPVFKEMARAVFRLPWSQYKERPDELHTIDSDRQGEDPHESNN